MAAGGSHKKELEEARRNGMLPPERDADGNLVNPHIPEFMSKAPWYMQHDGPTLKHQRLRESAGSEWARKRDPYANFDPREDRLRIERGWQLEKERQQIRAKEREQQRLKEEKKKKRREERRAKRKAGAEGSTGKSGGASAAAAQGEDKDSDDKSDDSGSDSDSDSDAGGSSDSEAEDLREKESHERVDEGVKRYSTKSKMSVRNLRIREDKAKYLYNLDPDSAFYDPKTHSMRENPLPHLPAEEAPFAGDNAVIGTGEVQNLNSAQVFAWEAYEAGQDVHLQGNPTLVSKMEREVQARKRRLEEAKRRRLLDTYGGEEHMKAPPKSLLMGQTEAYVEYTPDGRMVSAREKGVPKSKYEEDVLEGNHKQIWGSFFDKYSKRWGYACCRSTTRHCMCTGAAGVAAYMAAVRQREAGNRAAAAKRTKSLVQETLEARARGEMPANGTGGGGGLVRASDKFGGRQKKEADGDDGEGGHGGGEEMPHAEKDATEGMSPAELESYRRKRVRPEDPMAAYSADGDHKGASPGERPAKLSRHDNGSV